MRWGILAFATACFQPAAPAGVACGSGEACPGGQHCFDGLCLASAPGADATLDVRIDSAGGPGDADGDGVPDAADNCPTVANADQHDFDGDGHGDACDHCPHLASAADPDTDGDGVGDACDPRPMTPGDRLAQFVTFDDPSVIAGWAQMSGTWSVAGGLLVQSDASASGASITPAVTIARAYVVTGVTITAVGSGMPIGVIIGAGYVASPPQIYDCGLGGSPASVATIAEDSAGQTLMGAPWTGTFAAGSRFDLSIDLDTANVCAVSQGSTSASAMTARAETAGYVVLGGEHLALAFSYLFVVEIGS